MPDWIADVRRNLPLRGAPASPGSASLRPCNGIPPQTAAEPGIRHNGWRMRRTLLALTLTAPLLAADSFTGTIVDIMCRGKDLASHTRECAIACSKSGYGMVTAEGKFLKFDETGNAKTLAGLKKLTREKDLKAKVSGTLNGDVLKVETIEFTAP